MKKRVILAALALMIISGCSNGGGETSVSEPESTEESSVVSVAESTEVSEESIESKAESSKKESSVESKAESSEKESSVESKAESSEKESSAESKTEGKAESKAESKTESKVESKTESKVESKAESKVESRAESKVESKVESRVESKVESSVAEISFEESSKEETSVPATNKELPGFYNLVEMTSDGETLMSMKYYNEAGLYITLEINAGGTGVFTQYEEKSNMTWNDNYMVLKDYDEMEYSLSGDKLAVYQDSSITLVFERSDKETIRKKMEEASKEKELSGEVDKEAVGKYVLKSIDSEESIDTDLFGEDISVVLNDDGTGYIDAEGEQIEIEWVDGAVKIMNDIFYYEKHGNDIVIDIYGISMTFSKE